MTVKTTPSDSDLCRLTISHDSRPRNRKMIQGSWRSTKEGSARLCCPTCGEKLDIASSLINGDGVVRGPVACSKVGCKFRAWVTLKGWYELLRMASRRNKRINQKRH